MTSKSRGDAAAPPPLPVTRSASPPKTNTTHLFAKTRDERRNALTHAQIEQDLAAFERAGGRIEVLGNTLHFKRLSVTSPPRTEPAPADAQTSATPEPGE